LNVKSLGIRIGPKLGMPLQSGTAHAPSCFCFILMFLIAPVNSWPSLQSRGRNRATAGEQSLPAYL
jgi:hypothetical protein